MMTFGNKAFILGGVSGHTGHCTAFTTSKTSL